MIVILKVKGAVHSGIWFQYSPSDPLSVSPKLPQIDCRVCLIGTKKPIPSFENVNMSPESSGEEISLSSTL